MGGGKSLPGGYRYRIYTNLRSGPDPETVMATPLSDSLTEDYPFQWIQGDYNGDGKTDIGIFHLKVPTWYYALTTGTVPDLINQVDNGIGGTYTVEYANSSQFDHTGSDDIPDLPFNYKVMTGLTIDDGFNRTIKKTYQYRHGHTFSAFIDFPNH